MTATTSKTKTVIVLPALLAAFLLPLTACGGGDDEGGEVASVQDGQNGGGNGSGNAAADPVQQAQEYTDCLRDNGLEVEDPDPETGEITLPEPAAGSGREDMSAAMDACRDLAPESFQEPGAGELTQEQQDSMRQFAECMRNEGIDVPDPGPEGLDPEAIDPSDPATEAALEVCQDEMAWRQ